VKPVHNKVIFQVVSLKEPCSACLITAGLLKEMLEKLKSKYCHMEVIYTTLEHIREASAVEGLEVEKLPALIVNGEQITAGGLPALGQLTALLEAE